MAQLTDALENMLTKMLPGIINDAAVGPYISMSRMLDIVIKRKPFHGVRQDDSSLFPAELISHLQESGQKVENAHRITLTMGNSSSLSLQILAEAPGTNTLVRYRLVYTDGSITAESKIGYGSQNLTAKRFEDLMVCFELHRPRLTQRLDEMSSQLNRQLTEQKLFEQAMPIFVSHIVPQLGYPYFLDLHSRDYRSGAVLHLRIDKNQKIDFYLSPDRFEQQLTALQDCLQAVDHDTAIITGRALEEHQLFIEEIRKQLPTDQQDKVTTTHFVYRAGEILCKIVGKGCFKICYVNGLTAELYIKLDERLWLCWPIKNTSFKDDIDCAITRRTEIMRVMSRHQLPFSVGRIYRHIDWIKPT